MGGEMDRLKDFIVHHFIYGFSFKHMNSPFSRANDLKYIKYNMQCKLTYC